VYAYRMTGETTPNPKAFAEALKRLVTVPRSEVQKRVEQAKPEPSSRHTRYKYVPSERPAKP